LNQRLTCKVRARCNKQAEGWHAQLQKTTYRPPSTLCLAMATIAFSHAAG
jgi:hypothetical protein